MIARLARPRADDELAAERPGALARFALTEGVIALVVLVVLMVVVPVHDTIAIRLPGVSLNTGRILGAAFWVAFGLFGSLRAGARPGGSVLTFSTPFIVAGLVLGGPVVGVLMGLISEFEPRELRLPWYGYVSNHANVILSAAAAGLIGSAFDHMFQPLLGGSAALGLSTTIITAFVFTTLNAALVVPVLSYRTGASFTDASRSYHLTLRRTALAETILAWLMATTFVVVGWWAPVVCVALVVVIWRFQDQQDALIREPRTGLLNDLGFRPIAEAAVRAARTGRRPSMLLFFDLDNFGQVNKSYNQEAGDEVILAVARRTQTAVRATDTVARRNRAGDEFFVLYDGVDDAELALRLAERLHAEIFKPITLRGKGATVLVGASIGVCRFVADNVATLEEAIEKAQRREACAKGRMHDRDGNPTGLLTGGVGPLDDRCPDDEGREGFVHRKRR